MTCKGCNKKPSSFKVTKKTASIYCSPGYNVWLELRDNKEVVLVTKDCNNGKLNEILIQLG